MVEELTVCLSKIADIKLPKLSNKHDLHSVVKYYGSLGFTVENDLLHREPDYILIMLRDIDKPKTNAIESLPGKVLKDGA